MTLNLQDPYLVYYRQQLGTGVGIVFKGSSHQRGHGIGSFLGGLFRTIAPLIKSGAKAVGKEALRTGVDLIGDIVTNVSPGKAVTSRMKEFTGNLKRRADEKIDNVMKGSGYKKKKLRVTPQSLQRLLAVREQKPKRAPRKRSSTSGSRVNKKKSSKIVAKDIFD